MTAHGMVLALQQLRDALAPVRLPLELPGADAHRSAARRMADQLDDYVIPRLDSLEAPLLTVVGGSTGAGKSTLVNSLVGHPVTIPGVIRPTTRAPVLVHHPDDEAWFTSDRILPGMPRTRGASLETRSLQLVTDATLPRGLALLDAPDIDSVVKENRELAAQLLAAADLWLFVTSAARYADAVPWEYLRQAAERSAEVAVVVSRVPASAMQEVPSHLAAMMTERGLSESPLFAVPETTTDDEGLLPDSAVSPIRDWLADLARDQQSRQQVVVRTLSGAVDQLVLRSPRIAQAIRDQVGAVEQLKKDADASFLDATQTVQTQTADGSLLRGEVLSRWHDFVGTGEFFRALEEKVGWVRDKLLSVFGGKQPDADNVAVAVEAGLEALLREHGERAVERAEAAWMANPAGRQLLENTREDLRRPSADFARLAARTVRDWQGDVMELVAEEGQEKKSMARFLALGVNGIGVALMLFVFAQTAGITGAEAGVAGGAALLAQRVLEAVFGDDAVRRLAQQAKQDLDARIEALMSGELARFHRALAGLEVEPGQIETIDAAVFAVERARESGVIGDALEQEVAAALPSRGTTVEVADAELETGGRSALTAGGPDGAEASRGSAGAFEGALDTQDREEQR